MTRALMTFEFFTLDSKLHESRIASADTISIHVDQNTFKTSHDTDILASLVSCDVLYRHHLSSVFDNFPAITPLARPHDVGLMVLGTKFDAGAQPRGGGCSLLGMSTRGRSGRFFAV